MSERPEGREGHGAAFARKEEEEEESGNAINAKQREKGGRGANQHFAASQNAFQACTFTAQSIILFCALDIFSATRNEGLDALSNVEGSR